MLPNFGNREAGNFGLALIYPTLCRKVKGYSPGLGFLSFINTREEKTKEKLKYILGKPGNETLRNIVYKVAPEDSPQFRNLCQRLSKHANI